MSRNHEPHIFNDILLYLSTRLPEELDVDKYPVYPDEVDPMDPVDYVIEGTDGKKRSVPREAFVAAGRKAFRLAVLDALTELQVTTLKGDKGDAGPMGAMGPKGDKGDRGPKGDRGTDA